MDLSSVSSHKLEVLKEYGIDLNILLPIAYSVANQNYSYNDSDISKLCWGYLPEEDISYGDTTDPYYFETWEDVNHGFSKREEFILNSEKIERYFLEVFKELLDNYSGAFSLLITKEFVDIQLKDIGEVTTCIHCWK